MSSLEDWIASDVASLDGLLATIPPKVYFPNEPVADFNPSIKKRKTKEEASLKRAAKKAKFDPHLPQTVPEILASRAQEEAPPSNTKSKSKNNNNGSNNDGASIDELRDRLHAKMAALGAQRKGNQAPPSASASPAPSSAVSVGGREALIQESQRERAEAKAAKKKEKKLAKSTAAKEFQEALAKAQSDAPPPASASKSKGKGKGKEPDSDQEEGWEDVASTTSSVSPPAEADEAALVPSHGQQEEDGPDDNIGFSSLDFTGADTLRPVDVLPDLRRKPKKDAAAHALERLEERKDFLSKLTPQARERAEEKDKWENAAKKAAGDKVLDNPERLKKMTKRLEKTKDKSRQKWQERGTEAKEKEADRQKKRNENLQKRVQAKRDRKNGVKPKKSKAGGDKKKGARGFERSKPAPGAADKARPKNRGSISAAASKGKSASKAGGKK